MEMCDNFAVLADYKNVMSVFDLQTLAPLYTIELEDNASIQNIFCSNSRIIAYVSTTAEPRQYRLAYSLAVFDFAP